MAARLPDVERLFELEFFLADAMRFVPVNLSVANRTIGKANDCVPLDLAPLTSAIQPRETPAIAQARPFGDHADRSYFSDDLESQASRDYYRSCFADW
jgi:hypothetical protein